MKPEEAKDLAEAMKLIQSRQNESASQLLDQLAERWPQQGEVPHLQAMIAFQAGDDNGAADKFKQALELNPSAAHIHNNYANFLQASNQKDQAIAHYVQAVALVPDYLDAYINLGALLMDLEPIKARPYLEMAVKLAPRHPQAAYLLGLQAYREKDFMVAIDQLTRANQLGFEPFHCAYLLADIAYQEEGYAQAHALINVALEHPEPAPEYRELQQKVKEKLGLEE